MSDEITDPVVEESIKEEVSILAEDTTPKLDGQDQEGEPGAGKPHPLEPDGDRFKQVWARTKKAEERVKQLESTYQQEREDRIRLEERLKAQETQQQSQKEYGWEELETFISEGKMTRAEAQTYRDEQNKAKVKRELRAEQERESVNSRILGEIGQYQSSIPDVMISGSDNRQKYEREHTYMVRHLGMPDNYATQLAAVRAAFGDLDTVKRTQEARRVVTNKEPFMETHTPNKPVATVKDFVTTLSPEKKAHYEKMIRGGVYANWKEVEAEEKWVPKSISTGRR
ncbi:MAG: hypothetical protein ACRCSI_02685 [Eubacterium aggregans]